MKNLRQSEGFYVDKIKENEENISYIEEDLSSKESQLANIKTRLNAAESKNLEQEIRLDYINNKQSQSSNQEIELFLENDFEEQLNISNPVEFSSQVDEGAAFKERDGFFKNGFIKTPKQHYMLENIQYYNLEGVGQTNKGGLVYDKINECYWMITSENRGDTGFCELLKLSTEMKNGDVEVISRWYLDRITTTFAYANWADVTVTLDGKYLFLTWTNTHNTSYTNSGLAKLSINEDGTLGKNSKTSGTHLVWQEEWDQDCDFHVCEQLERTLTITHNGVTVWDDTHLAVMKADDSAETYKLIFFQIEDNGSGAFLTDNPRDSISGFEKLIDVDGYLALGGYTIHKEENILWMKVNLYNTDFRGIYRFDVSDDGTNYTADVIGTVSGGSAEVHKSSGRFDTSRDVDSSNGGYQANEGICISSDGHLLEVTSTDSYGKFISKRALKGAYWAENQISDEIIITLTGTQNRMIKFDNEDDKYIWYSMNNSVSNGVRIYRKDLETGVEEYTTLTGSVTYLTNMIFAEVNGIQYAYCSYFTGSTDNLNVIAKSDLIAALSEDGGTLDIPSTGNTFYSPGVLGEGIATDGEFLYLVNDVTDCIEKWSLVGESGENPLLEGDEPTLIDDAYITLKPSEFGQWRGLSYNKDKNVFYLIDSNAIVGKAKVYEIEVTPNTESNTDYTFKVLHQYQENTRAVDYVSLHLDYHNQKLWYFGMQDKVIRASKTLNDDSVMQLHSFINAQNVLLSNYVKSTTPITERYFAAEDFSDPRDVPDQQYMAVGYGDEGFSLLHLDAFLADQTEEGLDRYDVRKIRAQHYKTNTVTGYSAVAEDANIMGNVTSVWGIFIEKDLVIVGAQNGSSYAPLTLVDLKSGKARAYSMAASYGAGSEYLGSLSERNDGKGYNGSVNSELVVSNAIYKFHAKTFTKDDLSDYSGTNPKTYIAMGTYSGCDLMEIAWDSNGNRSPVKVWNNIFNGTNYGRYAVWIAPSGKIFGGSDTSTGPIFYSPNLVWNIKEDTLGYVEVGSGITGGMGKDISPNSRSWKTPSGQWRHQIIVGTLDDASGAGAGSAAIVDVENETLEQLWFFNNAYDTMDTIDAFEDIIYTVHSDYNNSGYVRGLNIYKKQNFDLKNNDLRYGLNYNNWDHDYQINNFSSPYFHPYMRDTNGDGLYPYLRYSKGILAVGTTLGGLQLFHLAQQNQAVYKSSSKEVSNPESVHYIQSAILPKADIANVISNTNNLVIFEGDSWVNTGEVEAVELSDASNQVNAFASFSEAEIALKQADGSALVEGVDYTYGSSLNDSENAVDITDTGLSGSLADGKAFRIVEDGANISNASGLNLNIIAKKDLTKFSESPAKDEAYLDPATGKFMLPRPIFWSKMQGIEGFLNPEISLGTPSYTNSSIALITAEGKFDGALGRYGMNSSGSDALLNPFGSISRDYNQSAFSYWAYINQFGAEGIAQVNLLMGDFEFSYYVSSGSINCGLNVSGTKVAESSISTMGEWVHFYVLIDTDKNLSDSKSFIVFMNGEEVLSYSGDFDLSDRVLQIKQGIQASTYTQFAHIDNLKIWNHIPTEDPSFEYNGGEGREDALHAIYSEDNDYKPVLSGSSGVGYYYLPDSEDPATLTEDSATDHSVTFSVPKGSKEAGVVFNKSTTAAVATISLSSEGLDDQVYTLDLYASENEEYLFRVSLDEELAYTLKVEHALTHNDSAESDYILSIQSFFILTALEDSELEATLSLEASDSKIYGYTLSNGETTEFIEQSKFIADGESTLFEVNSEQVLEFVKISVDGGENWLYPYDLDLSWGSSSSDYDDETIDEDGSFGVLLSEAPSAGQEVIIKWRPQCSAYQFKATLKQPQNQNYFSHRESVRLLDYALEFIGSSN